MRWFSRSAWVVALLVPAIALAEVSDGSEPLDAHSEERIQRYINKDKCPFTFDEAFNARCQYLLTKQREERAALYGRVREERGALRERLFPAEAAEEQPAAEPFDPFGPGFQPLDSDTEVRIQRYLRYDHCPSTLPPAESQRCRFLFAQREEERKSSGSLRKRLEVRRSRSVQRDGKTSPSPSRQGYEQEQVEGVKESIEEQRQSFDVSGPGSTPLDRATEDLLERYVNRGKCPVSLKQATNERCEYLLKYRDYLRLRSGAYERAQVRGQARNIRTLRFRSGAQPFFGDRYLNITNVIRERREKGGLGGGAGSAEEGESQEQEAGSEGE